MSSVILRTQSEFKFVLLDSKMVKEHYENIHEL